MRNKNGFTLAELLAVIVIIAIILVIAVPKIMNTIDDSRNGVLISSAKLIAASAETKRRANDALGIEEKIECADVTKLTEDYEVCRIVFDENGNAQVTIKGANKFEGKYICNGTKNSAQVSTKICIPIKLIVDLDGGDDGEFEYDEEYQALSKVTLVEPVKEGYTFIGWTKVSGTGAIIEGSTLTMGSDSTEIKAEWTPEIHTLDLTGKVDGNSLGSITNYGTVDVYINGELVADDVSDYNEELNYGTTYEIKDIKAMSGRNYIGPISDNISGTIGTEEVNVQLEFSTIEYEITYNLNSGTISGETKKYTVDTSTFVLPTPTRSGYTFTGWSGTGLTGAENYDVEITKGSIGDRTYTANWREQGMIFKYTGSFKVNGDSTTYAANSTYASNWYKIKSSSWQITFLSSGTLTLYNNVFAETFIVGGGGASKGCYVSDGYGWVQKTQAGSGGYHTKFISLVNREQPYTITIGGVAQATKAFGQTANPGSNGQVSGASDCLGRGTGGAACGPFETSGSTYSGTSGSGANTGKPGYSGVAIMRDASYSGTNYGFYTGRFTLKDGSTEVTYANMDILINNSSNWEIKFLTSGTFTPKKDLSLKAFIVGGGGASKTCYYSDGYGWVRTTQDGSGGYHKVFNTSVTKDTPYTITVGGAAQSTKAFGQSANPGSDGQVSGADDCLGRGTGGAACGPFETSGSTYSGTSGSGANTGKPGYSGVVLIKGA